MTNDSSISFKFFPIEIACHLGNQSPPLSRNAQILATTLLCSTFRVWPFHVFWKVFAVKPNADLRLDYENLRRFTNTKKRLVNLKYTFYLQYDTHLQFGPVDLHIIFSSSATSE